MDNESEEIDKLIARYRQLMSQITDRQTLDAAQRLIEELDAKKRTLHPER
jgi:prefoldin subunit 5